jgi:DNA phosphorothioation-dependent restriction protein DptG
MVVNDMNNYSEDLQLAFKQWHYNAMQGYSRRYSFIIDSTYSKFRTMNYNKALNKIKEESPKLFSRLEKMSKKY